MKLHIPDQTAFFSNVTQEITIRTEHLSHDVLDRTKFINHGPVKIRHQAAPAVRSINVAISVNKGPLKLNRTVKDKYLFTGIVLYGYCKANRLSGMIGRLSFNCDA